MTHTARVVVIGGQAGLAAGYHLRRPGLDFVILDARTAAGGAWQQTWDSPHLFSPAAPSSLPGRPMLPRTGQEYPDAQHGVEYLAEYEKRYELAVERPVRVLVCPPRRRAPAGGDRLRHLARRAVISATGTRWRPFLPAVPGRGDGAGRQLHTVDGCTPSMSDGHGAVGVRPAAPVGRNGRGR